MSTGTQAGYRAFVSLVCALGAITATLSCSSAPAAKTVIVAAKDRAAEFSKLADGFLSKGQYSQALSFHEQALRENRSVDNLEGIAGSLNSIGRVYLAAGQTERAVRELEDAREYARMAGSASQAALALANLGEARWVSGDGEGALAFFEEGLPLAARDEGVRAVLLHNRGVALRGLGRHEEARRDFQDAQGINQRLRRWTELAANLYALAGLARMAGDLPHALEQANRALEADKRAENSRGIAADLEAIALVLKELDRLSEAYDAYRRAFDVWLVADVEPGVRRSLEALLRLSGELDKTEEAARWRSLLDSLVAKP